MSLCQRCNKAPATVHLLDILPDSDEKRERHLCEQCAGEEGLTTQKHESINEILSSFIKQASGMPQKPDLACPECGMTFREFRANGLLGCPNDYNAFEKALAPLIERAHDGGTHHVGKAPRGEGGETPKFSKLAQLRRELQDAVDAEDYERAADLRDTIKSLESEQG